MNILRLVLALIIILIIAIVIWFYFLSLKQSQQIETSSEIDSTSNISSDLDKIPKDSSLEGELNSLNSEIDGL